MCVEFYAERDFLERMENMAKHKKKKNKQKRVQLPTTKGNEKNGSKLEKNYYIAGILGGVAAVVAAVIAVIAYFSLREMMMFRISIRKTILFTVTHIVRMFRTYLRQMSTTTRDGSISA